MTTDFTRPDTDVTMFANDDGVFFGFDENFCRHLARFQFVYIYKYVSGTRSRYVVVDVIEEKKRAGEKKPRAIITPEFYRGPY